MFETITKLNALLDPRDRAKVFILVLLMIITAFMQTAGIVSVMPFLAVLSNPDAIQHNLWLKNAYDFLGYQSTDEFLYFLGLAAFATFAIGIALQAFTFWAITRFSRMQQYELSRRMMSDYLRRPYVFFLSRNSGDLAKTVLQETSQAISGAVMPAMRLLSQLLLAASIIALLIFVQPWLALIAASTLGCIYGAIYFIARTWLKRIGVERVKANTERFTAAAEAFAGAKEIRLLGRERDYLDRFRKPSKRFAQTQANAILLESLPQYAIEAITFGGVLILVLYLMASGGGLEQTLPLIGVYALAGRQLIPAFQKIFSTLSALRFNSAAVDNILKDLGDQVGSTALPKRTPDQPPLAPRRRISLHNITYFYPGSDRPALDQINLEITANTTIGFVGTSGAGKSTLVDLLLGLLQPDHGELCIDETKIDEDSARQWQAALGYVPQHIFLSDQTVAENIALGIPSHKIDKKNVEQAARLANLHDFVTNELPKGYDTVIGERGVRLSGGQRQRIGIARALYRDPAVLFFDEATSALDNATERVVMEAIHNLAGNKTIILVAHRLSTVAPCNQIYVLNKGQIVEQGTYESLRQSGAQFNRLAQGVA